MDKKNLLVSAGVALLVVVLGLVFFGRPTEKVIEKVIEKVTGEKPLGSVTGPELFSDTWTVNGVKTYFYRQPMITGAGTTTICQIKLPNASTTIQNLTANFTGGPVPSAQLIVYDVGSSWATSTRTNLFGISDINVANGRLLATSTTASSTVSASRGTIIQGSTGGAGDRWILFDLMGGVSPFTGAGNCNVELREL